MTDTKTELFYTLTREYHGEDACDVLTCHASLADAKKLVRKCPEDHDIISRAAAVELFGAEVVDWLFVGKSTSDA